MNGVIRLGVVATTSMQRQERQVIEPGALDLSGDIWLLLGYDYSQALARTGNGTLVVTETDEGIEWETRGRMPRVSSVPEVRDRKRAGLLEGVVPGFVEQAVSERDGIKVVSRGMLCEINLVSRATGDGSFFRL